MKYLPFVLNAAIAVLGLVVLSCLASTMALFMGAGSSATDLQSLLQFQIVSVPIALVVICLCRFVPGGSSGKGPSFKELYTAVPQWLIFSFVLLNLLVASGEVALLVAARTTHEGTEWIAHAPLISMFTCSLAVCAAYARLQILAGRPVAFSGRWAP